MTESQGVLVISRVRFIEFDMDRLANLSNRLITVLKSVPGFVSVTLWERHDDPFAFMSIGHFQHVADANRAWEEVVKSPVTEVLADLMSEPINMLRFGLKSRTGHSLDEVEVGQLCSLSTRISDPGFGDELKRETEAIFTELKEFRGFVGGVVAQMMDVPEEVLGLAFWTDKPAFDASLPKNSMYRIDLYHRVL
ncbi:MAG: hypothetical protein JST30_11595 [Armatimonadetes bacterium]|nr:hypothetical protein [Armatimonadota bacterium]